jgi:lipopolysaccharide/colanic/teichoic acid biosynthesis glycosyltransferase
MSPPLNDSQPPVRQTWYVRYGKRCLDAVAAALALVLLSPLLIAIAVLVKTSSPGPVLFRQQRVGRRFRPFWMLKFRTMVADAPLRGGPLTRGIKDPRITSLGHWLRTTKLDELPQLWNVLVGEMSLVGPRPEVPTYVEAFHDEYQTILTIRPGITDPASLKYSNEAALLEAAADPEQEYLIRILPDKLALARQYVDRVSLAYDLQLLLRTLLKPFSRSAA